ncbi:RNA-splicing factor [Rhizophlyctis rosea]|nr:RNA-splicing factor [Rhizophlyctis rosea]
MGGGDLNLKKSWHPGTLRNQEKVWKKEQEAEEERKKLEQLIKEKNEERQMQELTALNEATGKTKKRTEKLDWMYSSGPSGAQSIVDEDREAYLLGKKRVDKLVEQGKTVDEMSATSTFTRTNATAYGLTANTARDIQAKVRDDPLFAIKQREQASLKAVLNNPIKMKQLKEGKKDKKKAKKEKKEKKRRRGGDESDSEDDTRRKKAHKRSETGSVERVDRRDRQPSYSPDRRGYGRRDERYSRSPIRRADDRRRSITPPRHRPTNGHGRRRSPSPSPSPPPSRSRLLPSPPRRRRQSPSPSPRRTVRTPSPDRRLHTSRRHYSPPNRPPKIETDAESRRIKKEEEAAQRRAQMMADADSWDVERTKRVEEERRKEEEESKRDLEARMKRLEDIAGGGQGEGFLRDMQRQTFLRGNATAADMISRNRAFAQRGGGGFMSQA